MVGDWLAEGFERIGRTCARLLVGICIAVPVTDLLGAKAAHAADAVTVPLPTLGQSGAYATVIGLSLALSVQVVRLAYKILDAKLAPYTRSKAPPAEGNTERIIAVLDHTTSVLDRIADKLDRIAVQTDEIHRGYIDQKGGPISTGKAALEKIREMAAEQRAQGEVLRSVAYDVRALRSR